MCGGEAYSQVATGYMASVRNPGFDTGMATVSPPGEGLENFPVKKRHRIQRFMVTPTLLSKTRNLLEQQLPQLL